MPRFAPGEVILNRGLDERDRVIDVKPVVVVEDSDEQAIFWLPLETPTIRPVLIDHTPRTPRRWVDGNWKLIDSVWRWAELLMIVRHDELRSTWVRWNADREFQGWYVNLQGPLMRTHLGFDIRDHQLDILIDPDRAWRWKDQDELDLAVELGRMTAAQAVDIRAEAAHAVAAIESNVSPYCDGWERWTPDPTWRRPQMKPGWEDVSMYDRRS